MTLPPSASPNAPRFFARVLRSVFPRPLVPKTDRDTRQYLTKNLILHFRPRTVPQRTLRLSLSWGMGGMAAVLVVLQIVTGILLKFIYEPTPVGAYASVVSLQQEVVFGQLVRNIHHWSANLMVLILSLHLLRVFFTSAFHQPRQFNWIIGLAMFATVLIANFTGYLLPYDQLAYWAVTVSMAMLDYVPIAGPALQSLLRGGPDIGPATLRIFFALHTAVVPVILVALMAFHFWRIRKAGGLVIPRAFDEAPVERPQRISAVPHLLVREVAMTALILAVVMMLAVGFNAPLDDAANPGLSPNPTRAPWYFAGLQELLLHFHPVAAVCLLPLLALCALAAMPYAAFDTASQGVWFVSARGRRLAAIAAVFGAAVTVGLVLVDEYLLDLSARTSGSAAAVSTALLPVIVMIGLFWGCYALLKRLFSANTNEAIQALFAMAMGAWLMLTLIGAVFRGPGMVLMWPLG